MKLDWELREYPMPVRPSFLDILSNIMHYRKLTQSDLSNKLSISKSLLSEILSGKKQPNIDLVINLYKTFGIDADVLLESIAPSKSQ